MAVMAGAHETTTTPRLTLSKPGEGDLAELHDLHADPETWRHLPSARHTEPQQTRALVESYLAGWEAHGLDVWVARDSETHALVGMGGPSLRGGLAWNVYYRLTPSAWGHGYAQEIIAAAREAVAETGPDLPLVARLLENNEGSRRAAERAGFELVWRGPDAGNPDPAAVRLILADRPLGDAALRLFAA